jgi:hypothetical protein
MSKRSKPSPTPEQEAPQRLTRKDQILALHAAGISEVTDLSMMTGARPSYIASVLHAAEQIPGYHDLYTSTSHPMNVYSKFFAGKLGYRDVETAQRSVELIDRYYRQFELVGDRAGQHHALVMALTMFDRARWTNKPAEAEVFRRWLARQLCEPAQGSGVSDQGSPGAPDERSGR